MRFSLPVDKAQEVLSFLRNISPTRTPSGDLTPVRLESFSNNTVLFSVVNGGSVCRYTFPVVVELVGSVVVGLDLLYRAVNGFTVRFSDGDGTESIKLSKGAQVLTITAKAHYGGKVSSQRRSLHILDCYIPEISVPNKESFVYIPYEKFVKSLRSVVYSVNSSLDASVFNGVLLKYGSNRMDVVATNGVTLTKVSNTLEKSDYNGECALDGGFVSKLSVVLSKISPEMEGEPNIGIFIDKGIFWVLYKDLLVGGPLCSSSFPKYDSLFVGSEKKFILDSSLFIENIKSIIFNSDKDDNFRLTFKFMAGEFSVSSPTCSNEGLPLYAGSTSLQIDFNAHIIEGAVKNLNSTLFMFSYKDRHSPVILEPYDSELEIVTIVAPLK